jgi:hypothetical protein
MAVIGTTHQVSMVQRTGLALAEAMRQGRSGARALGPNRVRPVDELLIDGLDHDQLPNSVDRTRLRSAHSAAALAINSFLPWRKVTARLPLAEWVGFEAIQFEVRCPTGLRGTPPHLDLLALRDGVAVAVTVRCTEYLSRRRATVAPSYDRLLASTPSLGPWSDQLRALRDHTAPRHRHLDLGALIKHALALGRTFPDRSTRLHYLFWEPLDAEDYDEFRCHRAELDALSEAVEQAGVTFGAQSFESMWGNWANHKRPAWLADHVARLRARYSVSLGAHDRSG